MPLLHSHITRFGMRPRTGSFPAVKCPYYETQREGYTVQEMNQSMTVHLVSSPDLIQRVYRFQYNTRDTESDPRWGWFWVWDWDYCSLYSVPVLCLEVLLTLCVLNTDNLNKVQVPTNDWYPQRENHRSHYSKQIIGWLANQHQTQLKCVCVPGSSSYTLLRLLCYTLRHGIYLTANLTPQ